MDAGLAVIGYELLFRDAARRGPAEDEQARSAASSQLLLRGFVDGGSADLCEGKPAFLNVPGDWIARGLADVLPVDAVVLEVQLGGETAAGSVGASVVQHMARLRDEGFRFAVDRLDLDGPEASRLGARADFVKVDVRDCDDATLRALVRAHPGAQVIATHVENQASFERCRSAGVHGFQGYFLSRPHVVEEGQVATGRARSVELLTASMGDMQAIEARLRMDPVLTYRLLRVANSAYYRRGEVAHDVRRALELLGEDGVRQWLAMVALAAIGDKPSVLLDAAMIRARTAELVAVRTRRAGPSFYFMVGMFSLLDALMDRPLAALLEGLPGSDRLQEALVAGAGPGAELLAVVRAQEEGDFEGAQLPGRDGDPGASRAQVQEAYLDAITWVREMGGLLR